MQLKPPFLPELFIYPLLPTPPLLLLEGGAPSLDITLAHQITAELRTYASTETKQGNPVLIERQEGFLGPQNPKLIALEFFQEASKANQRHLGFGT